MNELVENTVDHYLPIVEALIFASQDPISLIRLEQLFEEEGHAIERAVLKEVLEKLQAVSEDRALELVEVASGYQYRVKSVFAPWLARLTEERPQRYGRALLETLALIIYRQPVTRAEIEEVRGVAVSSHILRILLDRDWIKVVGHKDVPGKPALFATTRAFLDYFGLKNLRDLPPLEDFTNLDEAGEQLEMLLHETDAAEIEQIERIERPEDVEHIEECESAGRVEEVEREEP